MCTMVYLAASAPLRLVAWDAEHPTFHVTALHESETMVLAQFASHHVVYAGAHEGCGCGFQAGDETEDIEPDEYEKRRDSLRALADYLDDELRRVGPIEVHACWDGEQTQSPENRRRLVASLLKGEHFFFLPKEHSLFVPDE